MFKFEKFVSLEVPNHVGHDLLFSFAHPASLATLSGYSVGTLVPSQTSPLPSAGFCSHSAGSGSGYWPPWHCFPTTAALLRRRILAIMKNCDVGNIMLASVAMHNFEENFVCHFGYKFS